VHEIFINRNGEVDVYDGTSDKSVAHLKIDHFNGTVYVYSVDTQGKHLVFNNANGDILLDVDFSKLPGAQLQDGLFPDKVAYIGLISSPYASMTIQTPLVSELPDGMYHPIQKTLRQLADARGLTFSASSLNYSQLSNPSYYQSLTGMANQYVIAGDLDPQVVFAKLTPKDWEDILSNWDKVSNEIDHGNIPSDYSYDWHQADDVVYFAQQNQMSIRAQHLIWGPDLPDIFYKGVFSTPELEKLLEFMVKVRVLKYKGVIQEWDGADEACARSLYPGGKDGFWYTHFPIDIVDKVFIWTHEADPAAKLVFMEDLNFGSREWPTYTRLSQCYLGQLKKFKNNKIPVDYAGLEMNSWIFDPPSEKIMIDFMNQVKGLGYQFASAEANAVLSPDKYPAWPGRPKTISKVDDPLTAQSQIYHDLLETYLTVGSRAFGISGVDDGNEWYAWAGDPEAHSMIFDANFTPKPAYFALQDLLTNFPAYSLP